MTTKTITYEEVEERLKNVPLEQYTKQDTIDRYVAYGTKEDYNNIEIQKLMIKHGLVEELAHSIEKIITNKRIRNAILNKLCNERKEYRAVEGILENTEIVEDKELPQGFSWLYLNLRVEMSWNKNTNSWNTHLFKYRYAYCEEKQKQYKEEIDKNIGQYIIVVSEPEITEPETLCCILKNLKAKAWRNRYEKL